MSRRLPTTAAAALAALACGLGAAGCGGGPSQEQKDADRLATARWQTGLTRWSADMVGALNGISVLLSGAQSVVLLKHADTQASTRLDRHERTLEHCSAAIARLGVPPAALEAVRLDALRACASLEGGAQLVRDGIDALRGGAGIAALNRATQSLGDGQRGVTRVRAELKTALGSRSASS